MAFREINMVFRENQEAFLRAKLDPTPNFSKHRVKDDNIYKSSKGQYYFGCNFIYKSQQDFKFMLVGNQGSHWFGWTL